MMTLNIVLVIFIILETFNLLVLYFKPSMKKANGVGVFNALEKSKKDPEIHSFIKYLVYWVAGTKLIIVALLSGVLMMGDSNIKIVSTVLLSITIASFYWKMFPIIKKLDKQGNIEPDGYYKTLGMIVGAIAIALGISAVIAHFGLI